MRGMMDDPLIRKLTFLHRQLFAVADAAVSFLIFSLNGRPMQKREFLWKKRGLQDAGGSYDRPS